MTDKTEDLTYIERMDMRRMEQEHDLNMRESNERQSISAHQRDALIKRNENIAYTVGVVALLAVLGWVVWIIWQANLGLSSAEQQIEAEKDRQQEARVECIEAGSSWIAGEEEGSCVAGSGN